MHPTDHHHTVDPVGRHRGAGRRHHPEEPFGSRPGRPFGPRRGAFREGLPFLGRGRAARRGEVRTAILALLAEQPMHGYQVITELTDRSGGEWRPSAGSVYPTLQQLADEGLVHDQEVEGRRVYQLTDEGRAATQRAGSQTPPWERSGRDDARDLRRAALGVVAATMQVVRDGDAAMQAEARKVLAETRRTLYRLLADGDSTPEA